MARPTPSHPAEIDIPAAVADRPSWTRVGVIATVGLVAGMIWPRLAGVRLGPKLPEGASSETPAVTAAPQGSNSSNVPAAVAAAQLPARTSAGGGPPASAATASGRLPIALIAPPPKQDGDAVEPRAAPANAGQSVERAGAQVARVEWDVALIREAPKSGKVVARLPRGTGLHVGAAKDGWYPVHYGDSFSNEGWVYRGAIGR
jgi:hypothetical protein